MRLDLREIGCKGVDWIYLVQDTDRWMALVNTIMNLRVPQKAGDFLSSRMTICFSKMTLLHRDG
jgi:hypothetical protein